jgi:hypothetical protein
MNRNALARIFFSLLSVAVLLAGCGTVQGPVAERVVRAPTQSAPVQPIPAISNYQYGNFTVKVTEAGQQVVGGVFLPPASLPTAVTPGHRHVIYINYRSKELLYYRQDAVDFVPVIGYAVVTPDVSSLPQDVVRGRVTRIDTAPTWCPTENIRRARPHLPAGCIPFGHSQNAMGAVKFEIAWQEVRDWEYNRLHGTSGYPRGSFWEEETFGCTRLVDDAILKLVESLGGPNTVREGIEVIVHRSEGQDHEIPGPSSESPLLHLPLIQESPSALPWQMGW